MGIEVVQNGCGTVRDHTQKRFRERELVLPTFGQLADPTTISEEVIAKLAHVDPDEPHPLNLFRMHWYNSADRKGLVDVPGHRAARITNGR